MRRYTVVLTPAEPPDRPGYIVSVPALPGCFTEGDTLEEALANTKEAVLGYIESLQKRRLPIPKDQGLYDTVEVELAET